MDVDFNATDWTHSAESSRLPLIDETSTIGTQAPKDK